MNEVFTTYDNHNGELNVDGIMIGVNGEMHKDLQKCRFLKLYVKSAITSIVNFKDGGKKGFNGVIRNVMIYCRIMRVRKMTMNVNNTSSK